MVGASVCANIRSIEIVGLNVGASVVSQMGIPSSIISGGWQDSNNGLHSHPSPEPVHSSSVSNLSHVHSVVLLKNVIPRRRASSSSDMPSKKERRRNRV